MKRTQMLVVLIATCTIATSFSSSIKKKEEKQFSLVYYKYTKSNNYIQTTGTHHLLSIELSDSMGSWQQTLFLPHDGSAYLSFISFESHQLTIGQAALGVRNYFFTYGTLPADGLCLYALGAGGFYYPVSVYRELTE